MQRTVNGLKIIYAMNELNENGEISVKRGEYISTETDEKRAVKKAIKEIGYFQPLKIEKISTLYVLDDEIFFKYAKPVENVKEKEEVNPSSIGTQK